MDNSKKIIFVMGYPRSGTTLLQQIISSSANTKTSAESWMYIYPLNIFRQNYLASYSANLLLQGINDYLYYNKLCQDDLLKVLGRAVTDTITTDLKDNQRYIEKTPRNMDIISELRIACPQSKFIFIERDSVSRMESIRKTWGRETNMRFWKFKRECSRSVLYDYDPLSANEMLISYHELTQDPNALIDRLNNFLKISIPENVANNLPDRPHGKLGDEKLAGNTRNIAENKMTAITFINKMIYRIHFPESIHAMKSVELSFNIHKNFKDLLYYLISFVLYRIIFWGGKRVKSELYE